MQHEIKTSNRLLNEKGELTEAGWAKDLLLQYSRDDIKAGKHRIKEWDYYCVLTSDFGAAFTVADNGYMGLISVSVLDFLNKCETTKTIMTPFPMGSFKMPPTSKSGDVVFSNNKISVEFLKNGCIRTIKARVQDFKDGKELTAEIKLVQPDGIETMVIATPFAEDRKAFYYNQKVNCMPAEGTILIGEKMFQFKPESSSAVLDWGRGVWTYSNTWYWGSGSGLVNGIPFGFNIGYGFGDTSNASENMIFYNNKAHKLDRVTFNIPEDSFIKPWTFTSSDGRFEMGFVPIIDRNSNSDFLVLKSIQHQVFGYFTGKAVLDNGNEIIIKDFLGFAEKVKNNW